MRHLTPFNADSYDLASDAPPNFGWHRDSRVFFSFIFHNSLSVPITITGLASAGEGPSAMLNRVRLYQPRPPFTYADTRPQTMEPMHDLHIPAGGDRDIVMVWYTHGSCTKLATPAGQASSESVLQLHLAYRVMDIFSESQLVGLSMPDATNDGTPSPLFSISTPHTADCPGGYPLIPHPQ
jgi:hypothetical protein